METPAPTPPPELEHEPHERARHLRVLLALYDVCAGGLDVPLLVTRVDELLPAQLGVQRVSVQLYDPKQDTLVSGPSIGARPSGEAARSDPRAAGSDLSDLCLRSQRPIRVNDCSRSDLLRAEDVAQLGLKSAAAVPIVAHGEVLGVLRIDDTERLDAFSELDLELFQVIGRQLGVAVRNARLRSEHAEADWALQCAREELETRVQIRTAELAAANAALRTQSRIRELMRTVAVTANAARTPEEAMQYCVDRVCELMQWPIGHAYIRALEGDEMLPSPVWHLRDPDRYARFREVTSGLPLSPGRGLAGRVCADGQPLWVPEAPRGRTGPLANLCAELGIRSGCAFPVLVDGEVAAVLEFFSGDVLRPDAAFTQAMTDIGVQLGHVIQRKRAEQEVRDLLRGACCLLWHATIEERGDRLLWHIRVTNEEAAQRYMPLKLEPGQEYTRVWHHCKPIEDRERMDRTAASALRSGITGYHQEFRTVHPDGEVRWNLEEVRIEPTGPGRWHLVGVCTDITERKRAEDALRASEARFRELFDRAPVGYHEIDADGRLVQVNRTELKMLGYTEAEMLGRCIWEFTEDPETIREGILARLAERTPLEPAERVFRRKDGSRLVVSTEGRLIRDDSGRVTGLRTAIQDITARKKAEEELRRYARHLEVAKKREEENSARLAELVDELESAKTRAEDAARAKSEFLANMSHEIRTPMNGIIGMTELALETALTEEQREYLELVKASADSLLRIINDILDFSKIEARRLELHLESFGLRDMIADAVAPFALRAHQKGLELACEVRPDVPDALIGDPVRLRQVLVNLVSNAVKFTDQGEVVICVSLDRLHGQEVRLEFTVSDTGIGVAAEKRELIFHAFTQEDGSTTRRYGGTGLGLAISTQLVEMMGGQLWMDGDLERGSRFHFTTRLQIDPATAPNGAGTVPDVEGMPVLIVDDNATNRRILQELLSAWGMRPLISGGAASAMDTLRDARERGERIPLVLLDAMMPEVDGFELAARIRREADLSEPSIVMLSSAGHRAEPERCRELGISSYLTKPVRQSDLLSQIVDAVRQSPDRGWESRARTRQEKDDGPHLRVLLAEDNAVNQHLAVRVLEKRGHEVWVVDNGREAVEASERSSFDVLLMDIQMPEMNGLEAAREIRARERRTGGHLPIVAMTAYAMAGDQERCYKAGMDAYISKPLRTEQLLDVLRRIGSTPSAAPRPGCQEGSDVIDRDALREHLDGDDDLLQELIQIYQQDQPEMLCGVHRALVAGDAPALADAAHSIKGMVSNFHAPACVAAALRLEEIGRSGDLRDAPQATERLAAELEALGQALQRLADGVWA